MWKLRKKLEKRLLGEQGAIVKNWGGKASVALVYPNEYRIAMGNLAVHSIYSILNSRNDMVCERVFLPDRGELDFYRENNIEPRSLENLRPLCEFDAIAFSISFENDYLNILPMLRLSKIPHRSADRGGNYPLLIAGGAAPTINPAPLCEIFDAVFTGEFESSEKEICNILSSHPSKQEALAEIAMIEGASVETCPPKNNRSYLANLDEYATQTVIYGSGFEFSNMHLMEVQRGCPHSCSFCVTPSLYFPPRRRSAAAIYQMIDDGLRHRKRFGLIGADILSHPDFVAIASRLHEKGAIFSLSSIRADRLNETSAKLIAKSGNRSLSLGIEAGSARLRNNLQKGLSDDDLIRAATLLSKQGITRIRQYYMIGLPGEKASDLEAIVSLSKKIFETIQKNAPKAKGQHLTELTISPFIPKPKTLFAKEKFAGEKYLKETANFIKKSLLKERGISVHFDRALDAGLENYLSNSAGSALPFLEDVADGTKIKDALARHG
jgi:radical SAM superfamily enzyme YgiQ (UPF0313 family)